jgi:glyoxylase-like metal-dependent hydrolase (beta-lactamase superfamily II)
MFVCPSYQLRSKIVVSHIHFDHTGDPNTFPPSVAVIIGPGAREAIQAGGAAHSPASDLEGRQVIEISFSGETDTPPIASLKAYDFFGDGSFFLLDAPGVSFLS